MVITEGQIGNSNAHRAGETVQGEEAKGGAGHSWRESPHIPRMALPFSDPEVACN